MVDAISEILSYCKPANEQVGSVTWTPEEPRIFERKPNERDDALTKLSKKHFPLCFAQTVIFTVKTDKRRIDLTVNPFNYDGCTYPKWLKKLLGSNIKKEYRVASAIHDYLMNNRKYVFHSILKESMNIAEFRRLSSLIFRQVLIEQGVNKIQAYIMSFFTQVWQSVFNRKAWRI